MTNNGRRKAWLDLSAHYKELGAKTTIAGLFEADPQRFQQLSVENGEILLDYSKTLLTDETLDLLRRLAEESGLPAAIRAMYRGDPLNTTERRPALHVALRSDLPDAAPELTTMVSETLAKMENFVARVHSGEWMGYSDQPIRTVINIGIGGSDLGPAMVAQALHTWHVPQLSVHFVSN